MMRQAVFVDRRLFWESSTKQIKKLAFSILFLYSIQIGNFEG